DDMEEDEGELEQEALPDDTNLDEEVEDEDISVSEDEDDGDEMEATNGRAEHDEIDQPEDDYPRGVRAPGDESASEESD
ncbi:hypothetical protein LTR53_012595, partial [Teratosphaeriaceae sp. CCFEE 6253]